MPRRMAVTPLHKASSVMRLGTRMRIGTCLKRRRRCSRRLVSIVSSSGLGKFTMASSSIPPAGAVGLVRGEIGEDRLARYGALADDDQSAHTLRQIYIDTAAEANEAEALARLQHVAVVD